jgi:hypothetical protein
MNRASRSISIAVVSLFALGAAVAFAAHSPAGAFRSAKRATVAPPSTNSVAPAWLCRAQRDLMGAASFNQLWARSPSASRNGMGRCAAFMAQADAHGAAPQVERSIMSAYQACVRMRRVDVAAFRRQFGTNSRNSNAIGRCVRARSKVVARKVSR